MFQRILLPVDLTDRHGRCLEVASRLILPGGGSIILLHVIENIEGVSREDETDFFGRLESRAHEHLTALAAKIESATVTREIVYGNRARAIVQVAEEMDADLIVMASHVAPPDPQVKGWGTLSYQVGLVAPCSVMLVR